MWLKCSTGRAEVQTHPPTVWHAGIGDLSESEADMTNDNDTRRSTEQKGRGFTLVEVLIVIVILGVLSTVAVFAIRGTTSKASENACANEAKSMNSAYEAYLAQEQADTLPPTGAGADRFERTMVDVGILRDVSSNWEVSADGSLTAQAGGECV